MQLEWQFPFKGGAIRRHRRCSAAICTGKYKVWQYRYAVHYSLHQYTDDECLTPGQAFYLENKDKIFENIRKRYYEETKGAENVELTDSEIESLLPLLMEEEKFGSYDPNPVVPPSKHHLWDYNTNDIYIPKKAIHLHKGQMPTLQEVVDILEQVSLMR